MKKAIVYIHGKGGNIFEGERYKPLFPDSQVIGFDYKSENPWQAKTEFAEFFDNIKKTYDTVWVIAVSIGAFFLMNAQAGEKIEKAFFISPVTDMEKLISDIMSGLNITEDELKNKKEIETLSYEYLCYVRNNPVKWNTETHILYGEKDSLTSYETIRSFAEKTGASLDVMSGGEHWFHTPEQMRFIDSRIKKYI